MILIELQYLPPIAYFTLLAKHNTVIIEAYEHYTKGSYRNRCHIAGANGIQRLSIPLQKGKNRQQPIQEVCIVYDEPWQAQHWQSIRSAYGNAPFYEYYADSLAPFFYKKYDHLWQLNMELLEIIVALLGLSCSIKTTTEYQNKADIQQNEDILDYRNSILPQKNRQNPRGAREHF